MKVKQLGILLFGYLFSFNVLANQALDNLQPGHWLQVAGSQMANYEAKPPLITQAHYDSVQGSAGVKGVMQKWSGGTYDTTRDRLVVWGGGHRGYGGNEVYVFDINSFKWQRLTLPSEGPFNTNILGDGRPGSRHTYDGMNYIPPPVDRLYARGGGYFPTGNDSPTTWFFNFNTTIEKDKWEQRTSYPVLVVSNLSAYDPIGLVWEQDMNALYAYDITNNSWSKASNDYSWAKGNGNMVLDPKRRKLVRIGNGVAHIWDISTWPNKVVRSNLNSTGANQIESAQAPGFVYDPVSDKFIAWSGGTDIYVLDMDTKVWTKDQIASTNTVVPTQVTAEGGTFGRFQYVPSKNVFIGVNAATENVYFYRRSIGIGTKVPNTPQKPSVSIK